MYIYVCVCIYLSDFTVNQKLTRHSKSCILQYIKDFKLNFQTLKEKMILVKIHGPRYFTFLVFQLSGKCLANS